jgi:peptidoglycan/xylan/chitin deacetylase (PgdA/CDA1 family)
MNGLKRAAFSLARQHIAFCMRASQPTLYLTFDDGPHPEHTPALLSLLAKLNVHASFFVIGKSAAVHPEIVAAVHAAGHLLGNHSFDHMKRKSMTRVRARAGIRETDAILSKFDGRPRHPFRPPWGEVSAMQLVRCIFGLEHLVLWSRDSMDYRDDAAAIVESFRRNPPLSGDIILFHDDHAIAHEALAVLIPQWQSRGFRFDALHPVG